MTRDTARFFPWLDRSGRLSVLKLVTFVALFLPALWIAWQWLDGDLLPKPVTEAIHQTGDWTVRILVVSLLVTPLRRIADWPRLILVRRMLGVAAFAYVAAHFALYIVDEKFILANVASEIVLRIYLTIGFVAVVGLAVLAATSTDAMIRRLGPRWNTLHRAVYGIGVLAIVHYLMQSKIDASQATLWGGFLLWLLLFRLMPKLGIGWTPWTIAGLAVVAWFGTLGFEAVWYGLATRVPASAIFEANWNFDIGLRPGWYVLAGGLVLAAVAAFRMRATRSRRAPATAAASAR